MLRNEINKSSNEIVQNTNDQNQSIVNSYHNYSSENKLDAVNNRLTLNTDGDGHYCSEHDKIDDKIHSNLNDIHYNTHNRHHTIKRSIQLNSSHNSLEHNLEHNKASYTLQTELNLSSNKFLKRMINENALNRIDASSNMSNILNKTTNETAIPNELTYSSFSGKINLNMSNEITNSPSNHHLSNCVSSFDKIANCIQIKDSNQNSSTKCNRTDLCISSIVANEADDKLNAKKLTNLISKTLKRKRSLNKLKAKQNQLKQQTNFAPNSKVDKDLMQLNLDNKEKELTNQLSKNQLGKSDLDKKLCNRQLIRKRFSLISPIRRIEKSKKLKLNKQKKLQTTKSLKPKYLAKQLNKLRRKRTQNWSTVNQLKMSERQHHSDENFKMDHQVSAKSMRTSKSSDQKRNSIHELMRNSIMMKNNQTTIKNGCKVKTNLKLPSIRERSSTSTLSDKDGVQTKIIKNSNENKDGNKSSIDSLTMDLNKIDSQTNNQCTGHSIDYFNSMNYFRNEIYEIGDRLTNEDKENCKENRKENHKDNCKDKISMGNNNLKDKKVVLIKPINEFARLGHLNNKNNYVG